MITSQEIRLACDPLLSLTAINEFTLMVMGESKYMATTIRTLILAFVSVQATQRILVTQARPVLVSGRSNSVSGNYTGLSRTIEI